MAPALAPSALAAISMLVALAAPATASNEALQKNLFTSFKFAADAGPMGIADRKAFADAALAYWQDFDQRIPRNSPSDEGWLTRELDTTDTGRIARVLKSPQYALRQLAQRSQSCVELFGYLPNSIGNDQAVELYLWLKTTSCWQDPGDMGIYLRVAGLSNGELDDTFKMQAFGMALQTTYGRIADGAVATDQLQ